MNQTNFNIRETTEPDKKHEKKARMHLVQVKTGNEAEYMETFYMCFSDQD